MPAVEATMPLRAHAGFGQAQVQWIVAARGEVAVHGEQVLHAADLGRQDDAFARQADAHGQRRAFQRRAHDGLAHHLLRAGRLGQRVVLVHQSRQQLLVEAAPVHADAHRLVALAGDLDHLGKLRVALGAAPHIAGIDAVLVQRVGAVRMFAQQLVAIEMEVADQRHIDARRAQLVADMRHGGGGFALFTVMRTSSEPARARSRTWVTVAVDIGGIGIGHRLHGNRRATADGDRADQ